MDCKRIYAISRELAPEHKNVDEAWEALVAGRTNDVEAWVEAMATYNVKAETYLVELASLTPNSVETLRTAFKPRTRFDVWFSPEFLAKVAQYQSFNSALWTRYSGMEREPTFTVEELTQP